MLKPLVILGLALTFTGCATTSSSDSAAMASNNQKAVAEKEDDKKQKIICKRVQKVGTHFKKKQCWTAEAYAQEQENSRNVLENMQKSTMSGPEN